MGLPSIYGLLITTLLSTNLVSAVGSDTTKNDSSLWKVIPDCAQTCVTNFIETQYTEAQCQSSTDIKCLCRSKTPSGLTLGEAALSCTYALCDDHTQKSTSVYRICDSVSGAISETHATITATTFPKKTTSKTHVTTTKETNSLETHASTPTTTNAVPEITTYHQTTSTSDEDSKITSSEQPFSTPDETQTSPTPTNTSDSAGNEDHHGVSGGTVIGVSVASGLAGSFIICVAVFFWCKRWRQRRRNSSGPDSDFFEIGGNMSEPPGFSEPSSRRSTPGPGPTPGPSSFNAPGRLPEISEPNRSYQPGSRYPPPFLGVPMSSSPRVQDMQRKKERIGFAISSASDWADSPRSQHSQTPFHEAGAPSQGAGLLPKPLNWSHRPASGETLFEEEEENQSATAAAVPIQRPIMSQKSGSPNIITGLPANPRALKNGFSAERFRRAPTGPQPRPYPQYPLGTQQAARGRTPIPQFNRRNDHRASYTSNSSSTPYYSSDCSQETTANTLLTTPGRPDPTSPNRTSESKPLPSAAALAPAAEIVSRPRIVRGDDIKRVHIRSSPRPRPPSEGSAPWGPDDFWLQRGRGNTPPPQASSELPYPSERCPGIILYPSSPKKAAGGSQRASPTGRDLTPSKRGGDLILRVD
ncbi:hypothetical protein VI817_002786 [Penicillium citrinum]|nr:hypothetical protein VI817_002786 [Penicillium citrinum]